jgi:hypothetical protein
MTTDALRNGKIPQFHETIVIKREVRYGDLVGWLYCGAKCICSHAKEVRKAMPDDIAWQPDGETRARAATINPDDVECLKFGGVQMGGFIGYDPLIVYDRRLIRRFIDALKQAAVPAGTTQLQLNRVNQLMVCFKRKGKRAREPEFFNFFPPDPVSSFGPDFIRALGELSQHQADRLRQKVRAVAAQVVAIRVNERIVRDPRTVRQLLQELQQLDGRVFNFTELEKDSVVVGLRLRDGSVSRWVLLIPIGLMEARAAAPLSPTLWRLVQETASAR